MGDDKNFIRQMENVSLADNILDTLTESQNAIVEKLQQLQKSRDDLDSSYTRELNALRAKYDALYQPVYDKRAEILTAPNGSDYGTPALPRFWLIAMKNNSTLRSIIEAADEPILAYLKDMKAEFLEPLKQESFKITLFFDKNPYFSNKFLTKQYNMSIIDGETEALLQGTESTTIDWFPDQDVTKQTVSRVQRHKTTKERRTKTEVEEKPSFFRFFTSQQVPSNESLSRMTKQQIAELEMYVEEDYDIGIILRDKIIPESIYWYLGIAEDEDLEDDEDVDDEGDDDEGDDDSFQQSYSDYSDSS